MTSAVAEDGRVDAITLLSVDPNVITQIKSEEKDGYTAYQLGTEKTKNINKAKKGHYKASKAEPKVVREFRTEELAQDLKLGDQVNVEAFEVGDIVHVTGISKGKGWAGTIKRHNFHRGRKTHGGRSYRRPGSIGSMYPQRIFPGKKMAGQMGHERVTTKNLRVAIIDTDLQVICVAGAVPGPKKGLVLIKGAK